MKAPAKKSFKLINLEPGEADVLSMVADYAEVPGFEKYMVDVLKGSTPRAREIANVILKKKSANVSPAYKLMAKRFVDARADNLKYSRILKASTPRGLVGSES